MKEIIKTITQHREITEKELSKELGVNRSTLHRWKKDPSHGIKAVSMLFDEYIKIRLQEK
jgi:DNA-binding Xre family transcriptional regulator